MENNYWEELIFENKNFTEQPLSIGEYVHCTFINCNFANVNLSHFIFDQCHFDTCNLSSIQINQTAMREVSFINSKMLGVHFDSCNPFLFAVSFDKCILNLSSFYKVKLKGIKFISCSLHEVDFTESDLTNSSFENCDLLQAVFDSSILEKADFRTAINFSINPERNRIKKAKFSVQGLSGLLQHLDIYIE
ncbi:MAG: pentapeptide repeat-containing protein [Bacteroidota bacterium]